MSRTTRSLHRLAIVLALVALASCAPGILGVKQSISAGERTASATMLAFDAFDHAHQVALAKSAVAAGDPAAGRAAVEAWKVDRAKVDVAFASFNAAAVSAHAAVAVAEAGGKVDTAGPLGELARAAAELVAAIAEVKRNAAPSSKEVP